MSFANWWRFVSPSNYQGIGSLVRLWVDGLFAIYHIFADYFTATCLPGVKRKPLLSYSMKIGLFAATDMLAKCAKVKVILDLWPYTGVSGEYDRKNSNWI